jgi:5-(aminomethyl)-3-furanmethanol phosphate kinase
VTHSALAVIKVGGSLFNWPELPFRLESFVGLQFPMTGIERPMLIAGGGPAVEVVRELDRIHHLDDETAHHVALRAMDLSALLLTAVVPGLTLIDTLESALGVWASGRVPVLNPFRTFCEIDQAELEPLPASWSVTSDSIAARIAAHVKASRLILLKSASLGCHTTRHAAARAGIVDPFFPEVARGLDRVEYLNLRYPAAAIEVLLP